MAARYKEFVSAGESSLMMLALLEVDRRAEGFGEGVRTVILAFNFSPESYLMGISRGSLFSEKSVL